MTQPKVEESNPNLCLNDGSVYFGRAGVLKRLFRVFECLADIASTFQVQTGFNESRY